eukprot:5466879-Pyramimonas_sp.AAC.1
MGQVWAFCGPREEHIGPSWCALNIGPSSMVTKTTTTTQTTERRRRRRRPRRRTEGGVSAVLLARTARQSKLR